MAKIYERLLSSNIRYNDTIRYDTTLFDYAGHTQQKLVSRWGVGKHVRISYVCMDVLKINIFIYILHTTRKKLGLVRSPTAKPVGRG